MGVACPLSNQLRECWLWNQAAPFWINPGFSLASCESIGLSFNSSGPQLPCLENENNPITLLNCKDQTVVRIMVGHKTSTPGMVHQLTSPMGKRLFYHERTEWYIPCYSRDMWQEVISSGRSWKAPEQLGFSQRNKTLIDTEVSDFNPQNGRCWQINLCQMMLPSSQKGRQLGKRNKNGVDRLERWLSS